jgi:hypothetical protein
MKTAFALVVLAIVLFVSARQKWIDNSTLETLANIAGIVSLIAAILVFVIPAAISSEDKPRENLFAGPFNVELIHDKSQGVQQFESGTLQKNFTVETFVISPYSGEEHAWNAVIFFRDSYRIWIASDDTWGYGHFDGNSIWHGQSGNLPDGLLNIDANTKNQLKLVVNNASGCFFLNGMLVSNIDLGSIEQAGNIAIGISEEESKIQGEVTKFENFIIYPSLQIDC